MLADAVTECEAARLLTYRAASVFDQGEPAVRESSMAQLHATESAYRATKNAVQILGGNGFSREYPVERMYRDARCLGVWSERSTAYRQAIAETLIGDDQ